MESIKSFLYDLNNKKKSLILPIIVIKINNKMNDHNPRWNATSIGGINLISLKNKGWGIPQKNDAKQV
jgi:hypothetical protein